MKSKLKSLFFWAAFFSLFICFIIWGIGILIVNDMLIDDKYVDLTYNIFCFVGYLFIFIYLIFSISIFINKFPEKIKRFEKFKYLAVMFLLILIEMFVVASALPDLD